MVSPSLFSFPPTFLILSFLPLKKNTSPIKQASTSAAAKPKTLRGRASASTSLFGDRLLIR